MKKKLEQLFKKGTTFIYSGECINDGLKSEQEIDLILIEKIKK